MNCETARLQIGAAPDSSTPELEEHLAGCAACRQFREEMRALDARIARALEQPPQTGRRRVRRAPPVWQQWAMAASVVAALLAVAGVWLLRPSDTLAHEVVVHVEHEPQSWFEKQQVSAAGIAHALRDSGVSLDLISDRVVYAQSCFFRGHYVPHLVVQTANGPATVLILRHEQVPARRSFHEGELSGVIVPAEHGSIAVVQRDGAAVDAVAGQLQQDMRWLPER
jgi:hypothetical protein